MLANQISTYEAHALSHLLELEGAERWFDLPLTPTVAGSVYAQLLATLPGGQPALFTSIWAGPATVTLATYPDPPQAADKGFDLVIEASVLVRAGSFGLRGGEDPPSLVRTHGVLLEAGWVRMRVGATGREAAYDEPVDVAVEEYLVEVWRPGSLAHSELDDWRAGARGPVTTARQRRS